MLEKKKSVIILLLAICLVGSALATSDIEINNLLLKVAVHSGDFIDKTISFSSKSGGDFNLEILNLQGVSLGEKAIILPAGGRKDVLLFFNSSMANLGVYAGSIKVSSAKEAVFVPIIYEIESKEVFFDLNVEVPSQHAGAKYDNKFVAQVKIFDLTSGGTGNGLGATSVSIEYFVYGVNGVTVASDAENVVVNKDLQITKTIILPGNLADGDYVFAAAVKYGSSTGTSSKLFTVGKTPSEIQNQLLLVIALILILFLILIAFFIYKLRGKRRLFLPEGKKLARKKAKKIKKITLLHQ